MPISKSDDAELFERIGKLAPVLEHPIMRKIRDLLVVLTISHRAVETAEDLHVLQQQLLAVILELEERYHAVRRSLKRSDLAVKLGQVPPEQLRATPLLAEFFTLQRAIWCARRLGDSIAWKALGYDRFYFEVVGLGEFQGHIWGKAGSPAEVAAFEAAWAAGTPALLHGLTTVLRTGDLSVRTPEGWVPQEIKSSPTKTGSSGQKSVLRARRDLLATGTQTKDGRRLVRAASAVPFTHDLPTYGAAIERARTTGAGASLIEPRGNVLALHAPTLSELSPADAMTRVQAETAANTLRAIGDPPFVVRGWSEDKEAKSQLGMPYTSYPFSPEACVDLATGYTQLITHLDLRQVARSFELAGARVAEITLPDENQRWFRVSLHKDDVWLPEIIGERMLFEAMRPSCIAASVLEIAARGLLGPNERTLNTATHLAGESLVWQ